MLNRGFIVRILKVILVYFYKFLCRFVIPGKQYLQKSNKSINSQEFVSFTKGDNVAILITDMQYVQKKLKNCRL